MILFALAVAIVSVATVAVLVWGSENATSVESLSAAQAEAAMAPIDLPEGVADAVSADGIDHGVSFEKVAAQRSSASEKDDSETTAPRRESALSVDSAEQICSDATLTNLCQYARGEPIPTPTPLPTPTEYPKPVPKATTPRQPASTPSSGSPSRRATPAPTATRGPRPLPVTATQTPTPDGGTPDPDATTTPGVGPSTPEPITTQTPAPTDSATPGVEPSTPEPVVTATPAPIETATAEPDNSGDVVYIYVEPPSPENPSPPVMECLVAADGSLDCPEAGT